MIILDGKKLADKILDDLTEEVEKLPAMKLAVILVGDNHKSLKYIKQKQKAAERIGIGFKLYRFDKNINEQKFIKEVNKITKDESITGIVIQLPVPSYINIENLVPPEKNAEFESPTVSGIMTILKEYNINVEKKKVIIVGKGRLVGKPLAKILEIAGAELEICDSKTTNLALQTLKADILISATGYPNLIKEAMVKKDVVVIDAGTGDIDFENVKKKASYITPPIGGVGPMTVAMLMNNLIKLSKT